DLPKGVELAGIARYEDGTPAHGLELELQSDRAVFAGVELSSYRWRSLDLDGRARTFTAQDGSFRFDGLPPDWSGELILPEGAPGSVIGSSDESRRFLRLDAPRAGVGLELR